MKILNYLMVAAMLLFASACENEEKTPKYPIMENVENTLWWSTESNALGQNIYYDLEFGIDNGRLSSYDSPERDNLLSITEFNYTFLDEVDALILKFANGLRYDGYLVQKGSIQINGKDVYAIQLFEVDSDGNIIFLPGGSTPKHAMLFWRE